MITTNWTEASLRREAERNATRWRWIHSQLATDPMWRAPYNLWRRVPLLSRIGDRLILRARLRAYVGS